ncbi:hypothetical protein Ahy_B06g085192 [Arachis hypogaea]|uniref:Uncharacterized protein n=1 Tax=Arachis hypogaea TaxID=3818 RepID=A0A444YTS9_ARAHY|nr:hypothetical protein Ahy_B06g085192 [Arachis hypogaea]
MDLGFYMRQKLLKVHIPNLAHLDERVRQVKILQKEKERFKNEKRLKNKPFSRKEKVSYVEMESSSEESNFEFSKVDLAELKKGPPYVCSLLKKITSVDKSNDTKHKSRKKNLIQEAIMEGILKLIIDPFDAGVNFAEPFLGINMVGFSYEFDTALGNFKTNVRVVYLGVGEGLLDILMQQKLKDQDVSLCPRFNVVFDADVVAIFEKERMKKGLAHKEEQIR